MVIDALKGNLEQIKEIIRELYVFTNQLGVIKSLEIGNEVVINTREKKLLEEIILSLTNQLKILNNSIPELVKNIGFYKKFEEEGKSRPLEIGKKLVQVKYKPNEEKEKVSFVISDKDKEKFLRNLSKSNLSINQLKKKYSAPKAPMMIAKPNVYVKLSNRFFRDLSSRLIAKGHFNKLNRDLRKINAPFVTGTYVSMIFSSVIISFIASIFLLISLLLFDVSLLWPFFTLTESSILIRFVQFFWVVFAVPLGVGSLVYFYPMSEAKNLGAKVNRELPFVAIHMSAIATSGVEPVSIFKIILKSEEYKYTHKVFRKLMNLITFHGNDLVTALRKTSRMSPSSKLKELLDGLATAITSGGNLHNFLEKHSERLLFDYRLEREKYTKTSETFMDIYISIVIAAPMILLMLFAIMGSTGMLSDFVGLSIGMISLLIILAIVVLNFGFLIFLKLKQPII